MKEWKNKEVIAGLIVIIILGLIALFLLFKREVGNFQRIENQQVEKTAEEFFEEESWEDREVAEAEQVTKEEDAEEDTTMSVTNGTKESTESTQVTAVKKITDSREGDKENSKQQNLYAVLGNEKYTGPVMTERKKDDGQLKELAQYWEDYKLNAVGDLIRLERYQKISEELKGSNKFYYYGSVDPLGRPEGKGLAVYEDNTYYYGEWKEGLRHGKGMWLEIMISMEEYQTENQKIIEHSYNGQWSKDLPNGEGQEHFEYDYQWIEKEMLPNGKAIVNVIGTFKNGYYHGEMYIMSADEEGNTTDWMGNCNQGVWDVMEEGNITDAVWQPYEYEEYEEWQYHYIYPENNTDWGIYGLKK